MDKEKYNKIKEDKLELYKKLKAELSEEVINILQQEAEKYFDDKYKSLYFNVYTPNFNDGEPCEFTIGEVYFTDLQEHMLEEMTHYEFKMYIDENYDKDTIKHDHNFEKFLNDVEDILEEGIGTNHSVVILADGAYSIEEYDCGW